MVQEVLVNGVYQFHLLHYVLRYHHLLKVLNQQQVLIFHRAGSKLEQQEQLILRLVQVLEVLDLYISDNFTQLYKELDLLSCGYMESNVKEAKSEDMEVYYSREQLEQYGAVGIELRVVGEIQ